MVNNFRCPFTQQVYELLRNKFLFNNNQNKNDANLAIGDRNIVYNSVEFCFSPSNEHFENIKRDLDTAQARNCKLKAENEYLKLVLDKKELAIAALIEQQESTGDLVMKCQQAKEFIEFLLCHFNELYNEFLIVTNDDIKTVLINELRYLKEEYDRDTREKGQIIDVLLSENNHLKNLLENEIDLDTILNERILKSLEFDFDQLSQQINDDDEDKDENINTETFLFNKNKIFDHISNIMKEENYDIKTERIDPNRKYFDFIDATKNISHIDDIISNLDIIRSVESSIQSIRIQQTSEKSLSTFLEDHKEVAEEKTSEKSLSIILENFKQLDEEQTSGKSSNILENFKVEEKQISEKLLSTILEKFKEVEEEQTSGKSSIILEDFKEVTEEKISEKSSNILGNFTVEEKQTSEKSLSTILDKFKEVEKEQSSGKSLSTILDLKEVAEEKTSEKSSSIILENFKQIEEQTSRKSLSNILENFKEHDEEKLTIKKDSSRALSSIIEEIDKEISTVEQISYKYNDNIDFKQVITPIKNEDYEEISKMSALEEHEYSEIEDVLLNQLKHENEKLKNENQLLRNDISQLENTNFNKDKILLQIQRLHCLPLIDIRAKCVIEIPKNNQQIKLVEDNVKNIPENLTCLHHDCTYQQTYNTRIVTTVHLNIDEKISLRSDQKCIIRVMYPDLIENQNIFYLPEGACEIDIAHVFILLSLINDIDQSKLFHVCIKAIYPDGEQEIRKFGFINTQDPQTIDIPAIIIHKKDVSPNEILEYFFKITYEN